MGLKSSSLTSQIPSFTNFLSTTKAIRRESSASMKVPTTIGFGRSWVQSALSNQRLCRLVWARNTRSMTAANSNPSRIIPLRKTSSKFCAVMFVVACSHWIRDKTFPTIWAFLSANFNPIAYRKKCLCKKYWHSKKKCWHSLRIKPNDRCF